MPPNNPARKPSKTKPPADSVKSLRIEDKISHIIIVDRRPATSLSTPLPSKIPFKEVSFCSNVAPSILLANDSIISLSVLPVLPHASEILRTGSLMSIFSVGETTASSVSTNLKRCSISASKSKGFSLFSLIVFSALLIDASSILNSIIIINSPFL